MHRFFLKHNEKIYFLELFALFLSRGKDLSKYFSQLSTIQFMFYKKVIMSQFLKKEMDFGSNSASFPLMQYS